MKKIIFLFFLFYFLALIESSFFGSLGINFHLIFISVFLLNIFENPKKINGLISAFFGGFFLDIFSEKFFGFYILILLISSILLKLFLRKYVRIGKRI